MWLWASLLIFLTQSLVIDSPLATQDMPAMLVCPATGRSTPKCHEYRLTRRGDEHHPTDGQSGEGEATIRKL